MTTLATMPDRPDVPLAMYLQDRACLMTMYTLAPQSVVKCGAASLDTMRYAVQANGSALRLAHLAKGVRAWYYLCWLTNPSRHMR